MDLNKFLDSNAPLERPIRHRTCPFCKKSKNAFVVIPKSKGFLLWCHRCHVSKWIPRNKRSPMQVKNLLIKEKRFEESIKLPSDFTRVIPANGRVWLYNYGLSDELISKMGIGYSEKYHRLILPCYSDEELIYYQGRYLGNYKKDGTAKYISCTKKGSYYWTFNPSNSDKAVLVEDMLSAIKVGMAGYAGVALFGSYVKVTTLNNVTAKFDSVTVWLDPDKLAYAAQTVKRFSSLGYNVFAVLTADKDPKDYSSEEIKSFVNKATIGNNVAEGDSNDCN